jgi:hypothetical protein
MDEEIVTVLLKEDENPAAPTPSEPKAGSLGTPVKNKKTSREFREYTSSRRNFHHGGAEKTKRPWPQICAEER